MHQPLGSHWKYELDIFWNFLSFGTSSISRESDSSLFLFIFFIFYFLKIYFIYLFLAVLGLCCCAWAFSSCGGRGPLFIAVCGPPIAMASLVAEHGLQAHGLQQLWLVGSVVVVHGLSCSAACGIFPDQGSNPCPLHRQADSQPLHHQGSPFLFILMRFPHALLMEGWTQKCWVSLF